MKDWRCTATTVVGDRCGRPRREGAKYCVLHLKFSAPNSSVVVGGHKGYLLVKTKLSTMPKGVRLINAQGEAREYCAKEET